MDYQTQYLDSIERLRMAVRTLRDLDFYRDEPEYVADELESLTIDLNESFHGLMRELMQYSGNRPKARRKPVKKKKPVKKEAPKSSKPIGKKLDGLD